MALVLRPHKEGAPDDFQVLHGELEVGRIYQKKVALAPDARWFWTLNGVPVGPRDAKLAGLSATKDDALNALSESWAQWLNWARLSQA
jgi:hypothetical protein